MLKPYTIPSSMTADAFAKAIVVRPSVILSANSKLRKDGIYNVTMPAAKAAYVGKDGKLTELVTCPSAGQCLAVCYASSGTYLFHNSMVKHGRNLQFLLDDAFEFANQLVREIGSKAKRGNLRAVRWNDSGDFFSEGYWAVAKAVMQALPHVQFYAYTKMVRFFKGRNDIPSNLSLVFSQGGKDDVLIDMEKDRHARIFESRAALRKAGYSDGTHTDRLASNPKFLRIGLVIHGNHKAMPKLRKIAERMSKTTERMAAVA
jgi:hypothetical protein